MRTGSRGRSALRGQRSRGGGGRCGGESPLSAEYTETDWSFLLDTAYLHALYWKGDFRVAGELRLRVAKFGATPEDRARLRIQFAVADNLEDDADTADGDAAPVSARARRRQKKLRAV